MGARSGARKPTGAIAERLAVNHSTFTQPNWIPRCPSLPMGWDRVWYPFPEWISRGVNLMECGLCHRKGISCPVLVECALFPGGDENTPGETYVCVTVRRVAGEF